MVCQNISVTDKPRKHQDIRTSLSHADPGNIGLYKHPYHSLTKKIQYVYIYQSHTDPKTFVFKNIPITDYSQKHRYVHIYQQHTCPENISLVTQEPWSVQTSLSQTHSGNIDLSKHLCCHGRTQETLVCPNISIQLNFFQSLSRWSGSGSTKTPHEKLYLWSRVKVLPVKSVSVFALDGLM